MRSAINHLRLDDFRSYERADLVVGGRSVFLFGPNGAGKTNLLEAISLFSPGRGLRGASLAEMGRRAPGEADGRAWTVSAGVGCEDGDARIGTGVEIGEARRTVRIDGDPSTPVAMADHLRPIWLTPAQDRLFLDGASDRRRFLDRLVFAAEPAHAAHVNAYDRAARERMKLLIEGPADARWLAAVETRLARAGAAVALARARTVEALGAVIDARGDTGFPKAVLQLTGEWERMAGEGDSVDVLEVSLAAGLAAARSRDTTAGRALVGPHRCDLIVIHGETGRAAQEGSTGEQKALILGLILAQAARLSGATDAPNPILLLDEVAAHLDQGRRAALFDAIEALCLQAFLTGTDEMLFETLKGRALGVHVEGSRLTLLDG